MLVRPGTIGFLLAAALLLGGCAADLSRLAANPAITPKMEIGGLKGFTQEDNQCAAAALATVLDWAAPPGESMQQLIPLLYNPKREGTFYFDLAREIRLRGLLAYSPVDGLGEVLSEVSAGRPVIVLENRGLAIYEVMHWSVVGGHDLALRSVLLYEGRGEPSWRPLDTFSRTFARSGSVALLALPSGELPVAANPQATLKAIESLERALNVAAAIPFYRAFAEKYPEEWMGHFGLGNALYASGDREGARGALSEASRLAPTRPEPVNNLAMLSMESRDKARALRFASEAVRLAVLQGADTGEYQSTLSQISSMPDE